MEQDRILCDKYGILRPTCDQAIFQDLKLCAEERLKETEWNAEWIHDAMLIRFAKAFGNVEDGMKAIENYCEWRLKENVDIIGTLTTESDEDINRENLQNRCIVFPDFFDRCGRPIMLVSVRNHDKHHGNYPSLLKYVIWVMETTFKLADKESKDQRINIIFDLNGFGMRNMDFKYIKNFLDMLRYYYPERIAQCFIINYPWVFWGCWGVIKHWMNDVTRSKFIFAAYEQLNDFIDLDKMPIKVFL